MKRILASLLYLYVLLCLHGSNRAEKYFADPLMAAKDKEDTERTLLTTTEEPVKKNCMCSKIYDPVCGSDNKSYYNPCQLDCENQNGTIVIQHRGNCIPF